MYTVCLTVFATIQKFIGKTKYKSLKLGLLTTIKDSVSSVTTLIKSSLAHNQDSVFYCYHFW